MFLFYGGGNVVNIVGVLYKIRVKMKCKIAFTDLKCPIKTVGLLYKIIF